MNTYRPVLGITRRRRRLEIITDKRNAAALDRLLAAIRSQVLREQYRMDVDWMMDLMENQYGPLDWRTGFSHALYWSSMGDKITRGKINDLAVTTEDYFDWFRKIVDGSRDLDRLLEEDAEVAALAARLGALDLPPDETLRVAAQIIELGLPRVWMQPGAESVRRSPRSFAP